MKLGKQNCSRAVDGCASIKLQVIGIKGLNLMDLSSIVAYKPQVDFVGVDKTQTFLREYLQQGLPHHLNI